MPTETPLATAKQRDADFLGAAYTPGSTAGTLMLTSQAHSTPAASDGIARMDAAIISIRKKRAYHALRERLVHVQKEKSSASEQQKMRLRFELYSAFDSIPLESCVDHPADQIIERALREYPRDSILEWLGKFCLDESRADFAASVLRCLGRQPNLGTESWRVRLLEAALRTDNLEIRDAAAQTTDMWEDKGMASILRSHEEPVPWLREYIEAVRSNLEQ